MKAMILLLIAFLALVYLYTFLKIRQNRQKSNAINTVLEFNKKYLQKRKPAPIDSSNPNYKKQITKYNSNMDYLTKDDL